MTPPPGSHWQHRRSGRIAVIRWTDEVDGVGYSYNGSRINRISLDEFTRRFRQVAIDGKIFGRPLADRLPDTGTAPAPLSPLNHERQPQPAVAGGKR